MQAHIELEGGEVLAAAFRHAPEIVAQELKPMSDAALLLLVSDLKRYPTALPDSSYVRTLNLGRTWAAANPEWRTVAAGFEGSIGNSTPYGPYVQGAGSQAAVHAGRWTTDEEAIDVNYDAIKGYFERGAQNIAARLGGD